MKAWIFIFHILPEQNNPFEIKVIASSTNSFRYVGQLEGLPVP